MRDGIPAKDDRATIDADFYRIAIRDVAASTNERTLIATLLPPNVYCEHSVNLERVLSVDDMGRDKQLLEGNRNRLCLCAILNSYVADYWIRKSITNHLSHYFVYQTPIPRLTTAHSGFDEIVERSAKLICTTPEFDELAKEAGLSPPNHKGGATNLAERTKLRSELDGIVAHLYGLTEPQFEHVLSTFPLVERQVRDDALGEYRRLLETGEAARYNPELVPRAGSAAATQVTMPLIPSADQEVLDLIARGESKTLEFKSTARFNVKANQPDPKMERIIAKTVAAFLNSNGGTLLIGVQDDGSVRGLADDFATLKKADRDGFELWLMQTLMNDFEKDSAQQLTATFHAIGPVTEDERPGVREVCRIDATPSPRPRFVKEDGQEKFYIRTGNATNPLAMGPMIEYCRAQWPHGYSVAIASPVTSAVIHIAGAEEASALRAKPSTYRGSTESKDSPLSTRVEPPVLRSNQVQLRLEHESASAKSAPSAKTDADVSEVTADEFLANKRPIGDYSRDELIDALHQSIGPEPCTRADAIRMAARHLGFRRTGSDIKDAFKSAINGAIRRGRLHVEGNTIRR